MRFPEAEAGQGAGLRRLHGRARADDRGPGRGRTRRVPVEAPAHRLPAPRSLQRLAARRPPAAPGAAGRVRGQAVQDCHPQVCRGLQVQAHAPAERGLHHHRSCRERHHRVCQGKPSVARICVGKRVDSNIRSPPSSITFSILPSSGACCSKSSRIPKTT